MDASTRERLFGLSHSFDHPTVKVFAIGLVAILLLTPPVYVLFIRLVKPDEKLRKDLWDRYRGWWIFIPMLFGPVLLGAAWVIAAYCLMALACYREFARATGLFRETLISLPIVVGILAITFAAL